MVLYLGRVRTTLGGRRLALFLLLLALGALPVLGATTAAASTPGLLGVYYGNQGWAIREVQALESWQGRRHAVVELFTNWNGSRKTLDNLFGQQLPNIWANANVPLITWEAFTSKVTPSDIEVRIARGDYDGYVRTWAKRLAGFLSGPDGALGTADDRRAFLRLAHEPNGDWYPWGASKGANSPADYVAMWRRVHRLVSEAGPGDSTLQWVWAVNADDVGEFAAEAFYPSNSYVDWVAVDGYNWGASQSWSSWESPDAVLGSMVSRVRLIAGDKPLAVTETASTTSATSGIDVAAKSAWITDLFGWAAGRDVRMVVWFNEDKETDWAMFGGSRGDETFRYGNTSYRGYRSYRQALAGGGFAGSDPSLPRLLTDDQFAGR
ncbi:MAG: glycoside hydrolase family 26 protein [Actinomycetota bacterium]